MGCAVFPPCYLTSGQTMVGVMKIMATFKRSHACTATLSAPNLAAGHLRSMPPLYTPGHSRACLDQSLMGFFSGSWCTHGFVCALQESVSPVLCKFWWLCGAVNGDLLQEGLCHTQVGLLHLECLPLWQSTADPYLHMRHSNTVLSQSLWGLWVLAHTRFV